MANSVNLRRFTDDEIQRKRMGDDLLDLQAQIKDVVAYCLDSRKEPPNVQAAWLRDCILTRVDPLMMITQRVREDRENLTMRSS